MKIKYEFITGESVEVEVPDSVGEVSVEINQSIHNSERKETRRHNSFNDLEAQGIQIASAQNEVASK